MSARRRIRRSRRSRRGAARIRRRFAGRWKRRRPGAWPPISSGEALRSRRAGTSVCPHPDQAGAGPQAGRAVRGHGCARAPAARAAGAGSPCRQRSGGGVYDSSNGLLAALGLGQFAEPERRAHHAENLQPPSSRSSKPSARRMLASRFEPREPRRRVALLHGELGADDAGDRDAVRPPRPDARQERQPPADRPGHVVGERRARVRQLDPGLGQAAVGGYRKSPRRDDAIRPGAALLSGPHLGPLPRRGGGQSNR